MKEEYIENIEEAISGEQLFEAIINAFLSIGVPDGVDGINVTPIEITESAYESLPKPTAAGNIYFINDG